MQRARILVIEDNEDLRKALHAVLSLDYDIDTFRDAETALINITPGRYNLIIVDLGLPGMDGYKFCANLRAQENLKEIPIIILSGRMGIEDKLMGFQLGAIDFLTKPVDSRELKARIQAHISRAGTNQMVKPSQVGPFRADLLTQTFSYSHEGSQTDLHVSSLEFRLLHYFLTHSNHVLSRQQLLDNVWGNTRNVTDRSVDSLISKVRQKLGPYGRCLQSVHGAGYKLTIP